MTLIPKSQSAPYPPGGGYSFIDARTGMRFDGLHSNAQGTAIKIIAHRNANKKLYPEGGGDVASVLQEVYRQKFETHPHLFLGFDDNGQAASPLPQLQGASIQLPGKQCSCGANDWDAIYCKVCGPGKKVTGYKCRKCGKTR